jgi:hypothetical protein
MEPNENERRLPSKRVGDFLDIAANVCIIVLCVVVVVLLARRTLAPWRDDHPRLSPGDSVKLGNIDWRAARGTILVVMKRDCGSCEMSAPFYRTLAKTASARPGVRVVALLPEPSQSARLYLQELGISIADVRQVNPADLPISAAPALILVDSAGRVKRTWIGRLSPKAEQEVLGSIRST